MITDQPCESLRADECDDARSAAAKSIPDTGMRAAVGVLMVRWLRFGFGIVDVANSCENAEVFCIAAAMAE